MKRKSRILILSSAGFLLLAFVLRGVILADLGGYLVNDQPPEKAEIGFVLAGDSAGNRILKGAEMVRQGYIPQLMVSGPGGAYGHYECDLAIPFAVKAGYPESYFVHFEHRATSTTAEAQAAIDEFRKHGYKRVLLVTSDYHTRRTGRVFRSAAPEITFDVVAAPDFYFSVDGWWRNREGRKTFAIEWAKTVADWFGI